MMTTNIVQAGSILIAIDGENKNILNLFQLRLTNPINLEFGILIGYEVEDAGDGGDGDGIGDDGCDVDDDHDNDGDEIEPDRYY